MHRPVRAVALALAAAAAFPASAAAAEPSVERIGRHLDRAQSTVERAAKLVRLEADRNGSKARSTGKRARKTIVLARRRAQNAARGARKLARSADTSAERVDAAWALTMAAALQGDNVARFAGLLDDADPKTARALAGALPSGLSGVDAALAALRGLAVDLEGEERAAVEQAIAWLTTTLPAQIQELAQATEGDLPARIEAIVEEALRHATSTLDVALSRLEQVLALLPEPAQAPVAMALGIVREQLGTAMQLVDQVSTLVSGQLGTAMGIVDGLLGSLPVAGKLPVAGLPLPGAAGTADPADLLDGVLEQAPVGGDLLEGLLGGLLGAK